MKILILDDREIRHEYFRNKWGKFELTHVYTAKECIEKLENNNYDLITLDHDLGDEEMVESGPNTGYEVAKWLAQHPEKQPGWIYLHSLNSVGRKNMKFLLPEAHEQPCEVC